jgi:hypothetical protein
MRIKFTTIPNLFEGTATPPSFAEYLPENYNMAILAFNQTAYIARSIFGAGSDTTASVISIGVLATVCFPEEARSAKEELESVVGAGRAPMLVDPDGASLSWSLCPIFCILTLRRIGFAHKVRPHMERGRL